MRVVSGTTFRGSNYDGGKTLKNKACAKTKNKSSFKLTAANWVSFDFNVAYSSR